MSYSSIFRFIACLKRNEIFTIGKFTSLDKFIGFLSDVDNIFFVPY